MASTTLTTQSNSKWRHCYYYVQGRHRGNCPQTQVLPRPCHT